MNMSRCLILELNGDVPVMCQTGVLLSWGIEYTIPRNFYRRIFGIEILSTYCAYADRITSLSKCHVAYWGVMILHNYTRQCIHLAFGDHLR